jgi:hypothetical protein
MEGSSVSLAFKAFLQGLKPEGTRSLEDPGTTSNMTVNPWGWATRASFQFINCQAAPIIIKLAMAIY